MCNKWMIVLLLLTMALLPAAAENAWQNEDWTLHLAEDTLIFTLRSKETGHEIASAVQEPDKSSTPSGRISCALPWPLSTLPRRRRPPPAPV